MMIRGLRQRFNNDTGKYDWEPCFIVQLDTMQRKATVCSESGVLDTVNYSSVRVARSSIPLFDKTGLGS